MTIIISSPQVSASHIGYKNLLTDASGTITASSEATGYSKENAYDWRPFTWWKPTATGDSWLRVSFLGNKSADYFAVAAHNLSSSFSSIKLQYSTDGGSTWIDATSATSGILDRVIFVYFGLITASNWRVLVNNPSSIASIGVISFGEALTMPWQQEIGFEPAALARKSSYLTNESNTGLLLGRSIERTGYSGAIKMPMLDPAWVRANWERFIDHAEIKPFFFSWDSTSYASEAVFAWTNGSLRPPRYDHAMTMSVSLEFNAKR